MKKKLLCLILTLAIFVTTLSLGVGITYASAESLLSEGQEGLLRSLNITLAGDTISYDKQMTRGEMAHILARVMALPEYSGAESYFYDVPMDYLYARDIMALVDANVVHGDGDGKYRPNESVTEGEVCKLFVGAIGFTKLEDMVTYQKFANRHGITDGVDGDGIITYAEALRIAHNTLHCGMYEGHTFGENVEGSVNEDYLAIERYHGLVYHTGVVRGVSGTTLTHTTEEIPDGYVRINDNNYRYNDEEILGHAVVYYVKRAEMKPNQVPVIPYLYSNTELTHTFTILDEDIVGRKGKTAFTYMQGSYEREIKTVENPDIIYNGVAYPRCTDAELNPESGSVTWIDNNGDMIYDVASVSSYEYMVVDSVNVNDTIIYGKYPAKVIGDANRETKLDMIYGLVKTYITTIKSGDVIAVKASKNDTGVLKLRIEMLPSTASAPIEGIAEDSYTVNGKTYKRTSATVVDTASELGDIVNVYTHNGRAGAIIHAENDNYQYGYLVGIAEVGNAFSKQFKIRLVNQDREKAEFDLAKKVFVDETKMSCSDLAGGTSVVLNSLADSANQFSYRIGAENLPFAQMIRYKLNNDGVVTHIDTAYYDTNTEEETSLQRSFTMADAEFETEFPSKKMNFYVTSRNFINGDKGRTAFVSPGVGDIWQMDPANRDDLEYWGSSDFTTKQYTKTQYIIEAYNVDPETLIAKQVVVYDSSGILRDPSASVTGTPGIISNLETILDEDGMPVTRIELTGSATTKVSYLVEDAPALQIGDIVDVVVAGDKIRAIKKVFSPATGMETSNPYTKGNQEEYYQNTRVAYGKLISFRDNYLLHTTTMEFDENTPVSQLSHYYAYKVDKTPIYLYDSSRPDLGVRQGTDMDVLTFNMDPETKQKTVLCSSAARLNYIFIVQ